MKFHNIIKDLLASKIKVSVLNVLSAYPQKKFSGRELSRLAKISPSNALRALEVFNRYGIVNKTRIGRTTQWILNKKNLITSRLSSILKIDEEMFSMLKTKIRKAFSKNKKVVSVILFGSISKGTEGPRSDIDLFIEVRENRDKKEANKIADVLNDDFIPKYGNAISPLIYSSEELKYKKDTVLVKQIKEGMIIVKR